VAADVVSPPLVLGLERRRAPLKKKPLSLVPPPAPEEGPGSAARLEAAVGSETMAERLLLDTSGGRALGAASSCAECTRVRRAPSPGVPVGVAS
jgi:hypothetical protein